MTATTFVEFADYVRPFIPGVPDTALQAAVRSASIEFCDQSMYWIYDHDPITTLADINEYDLDAPCDGIPARVLVAFFNDIPLVPKSEDQLVNLFGDNWRDRTGDPRYYLQDRYEDLIVAPCPTERTANAITLRIAVKPTQSSTEIDSDVYEQWAEYIGYGARARLHEIPNQMYSDPAMSARCWAMFKYGIGKAKIERNRSLTRARQFLQPSRGAL
jgi:hypothetical protein